ncbi:CoA-transferase [Microbacterium sp. Se63.02b]|uniref:CoA transferase subunit A n=1 Tax=Microbacterium sp. Se63.02b TaxID=2709304 RepID=UPI001FCEB4B3|nr:CoA-transferase [Microbacterium sp. Se63.02b]
MVDKTMTEAEVVSRLRSGMTIGIGGWGSRRKPMSLVKEIVRSDLDDLTIVSYGGPDVGILCAAGKVRKVVFGFVSLDSIPLDPHFRAARQNGTIEVEEYDEGMLQWGLQAAGIRLPYLPTRAGLGSDVMRVNPHLQTVVDPYEGETLVAMPAIPLDAALVHMNRADIHGNAQYLGPDLYFDDLFCLAAENAYVSAERIVATAELTADAHPATIRIPGCSSAASSRLPVVRTSPRAFPTTTATNSSSANTSPPRRTPSSGRDSSTAISPGPPSPWTEHSHERRHPRRGLRRRLRRCLSRRRRDHRECVRDGPRDRRAPRPPTFSPDLVLSDGRPPRCAAPGRSVVRPTARSRPGCRSTRSSPSCGTASVTSR